MGYSYKIKGKTIQIRKSFVWCYFSKMTLIGYDKANIFSLFRKYSGQINFIGNVDMGMLAFGTTKKIHQYVSNLIKMAKKTQNFIIISPTQQISSIVPPKNIKAMIQAVKDY